MTSLQEVITSLSNTRNIQLCVDHIDGVMVSVLTSSAVDRVFQARVESDQIQIGI